MDLSKPLKAVTSILMRQSKSLISSKMRMNLVYKKIGGSRIVFLILYVDDILLMENDIALLQMMKDWLTKKFSIKDLGEAAYILGMEDRPWKLFIY